ncbi:MAG: putative phage tail protein [Cloacibacillus sp.]
MDIKAFLEMIWGLYPQGLAWNRESGVLNTFNNSCAYELVNVDARKEALLREADPRKTEELISDWEIDYGLPDECTPLAATLEGRRGALLAKIRARGEMTPEWYLRLAQDLGYDVDLEEWRPFVCAASQCGSTDMTGNENVRYVWSFRIFGTNQEYFVTGTSACGDPLGSWRDAAEFICRVNKLRPSHTKVFFFYEEARA